MVSQKEPPHETREKGEEMRKFIITDLENIKVEIAQERLVIITGTDDLEVIEDIPEHLKVYQEPVSLELDDPGDIINRKFELDEFLLDWVDGRIMENFGVETGSMTFFKNNKILGHLHHHRVRVPIEVEYVLPTTKGHILELILATIKKTPELSTGTETFKERNKS
jgi:hypothetical protein